MNYNPERSWPILWSGEKTQASTAAELKAGNPPRSTEQVSPLSDGTGIELTGAWPEKV